MSPLDGPSGPRSLYVQLVAHGVGDAFDRHAFACALAVGADETDRPLSRALGLSAVSIGQLCDAFFPAARPLLPPLPPGADTGEDALEEPDLRRLLLDHRTRGTIEEDWLAAIIARRSLRPNHLWQDLGLFNRSDLGRLLHRHFEPLAKRNMRDMKWKKFFYRELCIRDGVLVCKAPVCDVCSDFVHCFGAEGEPLARLQARAAAESEQ
jgi:nitrogen fixation protein NifQ